LAEAGPLFTLAGLQGVGIEGRSGISEDQPVAKAGLNPQPTPDLVLQLQLQDLDRQPLHEDPGADARRQHPLGPDVEPQAVEQTAFVPVINPVAAEAHEGPGGPRVEGAAQHGVTDPPVVIIDRGGRR
jgi:hypothetical protein